MAKIRCDTLESKNQDLTNNVGDLKKLLRRVADEGNHELLAADEKIVRYSNFRKDKH